MRSMGIQREQFAGAQESTTAGESLTSVTNALTWHAGVLYFEASHLAHPLVHLLRGIERRTLLK